MSQTPDTPSPDRPDWSREAPGAGWMPGARLLRTIRRYQAARVRGGVLGALLRRRWALSHRVWSVISGAEIQLNGQIGGGLRIPHAAGIVIHPDSVIGPNCTLMSGVVLGVDRSGRAPRIGGAVDIGAHACIIGGVTIGDGAQIGAGAVVVRDVPPGATAVGVPARVIGGGAG